MSVYNTEPVKNNKGGDKPANKNTTTTNPNGSTTKTFSYSVVSDFYYQNRGKLFDEESGKYLDAADFAKKMVSGVAGAVYNTLLLITVEGKVAQITLNAGRVTASSISLAADDVNVLSSIGISTVATLIKPTFASYKFSSPVLNNAADKLKSSDDVLKRVAGKSIEGWTNAGTWIHDNVYHKLPHINLPEQPFGHHAIFTLPVVGLQNIEAGFGKNIAKSIIPGYKKHYEPWANGHGELNQNYLEENGYSATNLENIQSTNAVTRNAAIQRMTVLQTNLKDNARVATILVKPSYSPPPKSELEQLEGFITEFDSRKSKNIWLQRLDRIFQPEVYASYDKALEAAKELRAAKNRTLGWHNLTKLPANIAGLAYDLILSDIVKNIKKIRQGYSGKQKLDAGIDYNSTFTNQLAQYKTDLEAAGGKFNIDASGNFTVETPPEKKEKKAALTTTRIITTETFKELKTNTNAASNPGTTGTILYTNLRMAADFDKVRNNQAAITGLVNNANETARQQNNIASMQNLQKTLEEQAIAERTQAYNMFIQQNKQLAGKSIMLIMPLFYTAYPKFAPKGFSNPAQKTR